MAAIADVVEILTFARQFSDRLTYIDSARAAKESRAEMGAVRFARGFFFVMGPIGGGSIRIDQAAIGWPVQESNFSTLRALLRRNRGHTLSLNGTDFMSVIIRSSERPIGK